MNSCGVKFTFTFTLTLLLETYGTDGYCPSIHRTVVAQFPMCHRYLLFLRQVGTGTRCPSSCFYQSCRSWISIRLFVWLSLFSRNTSPRKSADTNESAVCTSVCGISLTMQHSAVVSKCSEQNAVRLCKHIATVVRRQVSNPP